MPITNIHNISNEKLLKNQSANTAAQNLENQTQYKASEITKENKVHSDNIKEVIENDIKKEEIQDAVNKMNKTIQIFNKRLQFSFHEESKRIVVKIIDSENNKVVKEIPPKEVLTFISRLHQSIGALIDEKQ